MNKESLEVTTTAIWDQYQQGFRGPFPYADCRKLLRQDAELYESLIPDLDLYFSDIAGYCSDVKRISQWSDERLGEAEKTIRRSFFERHQQYEPLKLEITESNTPDLHKRLALCERLRIKFLELLSFIDDECFC